MSHRGARAGQGRQENGVTTSLSASPHAVPVALKPTRLRSRLANALVRLVRACRRSGRTFLCCRGLDQIPSDRMPRVQSLVAPSPKSAGGRTMLEPLCNTRSATRDRARTLGTGECCRPKLAATCAAGPYPRGAVRPSDRRRSRLDPLRTASKCSPPPRPCCR
jgi:hypothetical protein